LKKINFLKKKEGIGGGHISTIDYTKKRMPKSLQRERENIREYAKKNFKPNIDK
jgi:hypothetical protein